MKYIFLFFLLVSNVTPSAVHRFHISKCSIEYQASEQSLQCSLHLFVDDLENALKDRVHKKMRIGTKREHPSADSLVEGYLRQQLKFEVNGEVVSFDWVGKEISEDLHGMWCYFELPQVDYLEQLKVENRVFFDLFDDQQNVIEATFSHDQTGFLLLTRENPSGVFNL